MTDKIVFDYSTTSNISVKLTEAEKNDWQDRFVLKYKDFIDKIIENKYQVRVMVSDDGTRVLGFHLPNAPLELNKEMQDFGYSN